MNQKHLSLSSRLARESNKLSQRFSINDYSKNENVDRILLRRDISVEKKKGMLLKMLHNSIVKAFSIDKSRFHGKSFDLLKKRLHNIRKVIIKLRSINYYLETIFVEELKLSGIKSGKDRGFRKQYTLARDELEALEYTAYKLIGEAVVLDKRLLREYKKKAKTALGKEKTEVKGIKLILIKESAVLEHMEAKIPPPKMASPALVREPNFTNWVARIFSILSYLEHLYSKECIVFSKLKQNKAAKARISKKISHLLKERLKLISIMEEKEASMKKLGLYGKKELHSLTTTINI